MNLFGQPKVLKQVNTYISEKHNQILIVPCHYNNAGITFEQEKAAVLELNISDFELGKHVVENFELFKHKEQNLRNFKVSDWMTLKLSKSKSMNSFYEDYYSIRITGLTSENSTLRITASPYKDSDIELSSIISKTRTEDIGNLIIRMYSICKSGLIK